MKRGYFITLEGIEGVGKSTCLKIIDEFMQSKHIEHIKTREPGGTPVGEKIRDLILQEQEEPILAQTECLLVFASRAQHLANVVIPSLNAGKWVVCDRFTDATYAYQGGGRGIPEERIAIIEQWVHADFQPDLTILLDASLSTALERARARGNLDRIEAEDEAFFHAVRENYLQRAKTYSDRYRLIDANKTLAEVETQIKATLEDWIASHD